MADVISAVRTYFLSKSAITDVVGQRIYLHLPQNATLPAVTLSRTSETHDHLISARSGFVQTRIQVESYSRLRTQAWSIAELIYKCGIDAVKGVTNDVNIRGVQVEDGRRDYVLEDTAGGDDHVFVTQFDLLVSYLEA